MKVGGVQPLSLCDYPSTPASVIFLQGCNLRCPFCHNRALIPAASNIHMTPEGVISFLEKRKTKISGVVISGGEPTVHPNLPHFLKAIKKRGFKIKLDTNGTNPSILQKLMDSELLDYIAMDIKAPWSKYAQLSGTDVELKDIRNSIEIISNNKTNHHFRTTYYQAMLNDDDLDEINSYLPPASQFIVQKYIPTI